MRVVLSGCAIVLLASAPAAAAETKAIRESWGKAGVGFDQYRADAIACGHAGYDRDIADTDAAKAFVTASKEYDTTLNGTAAPQIGQDPQDAAQLYASRLGQIKASLDPDRRMKEIGDLQQSTVEACLTQHGYHRFRLTQDQRRHLAKLKIGSPERHDYLYRLASDPEVLDAQTIDAAAEHTPPRPDR